MENFSGQSIYYPGENQFFSFFFWGRGKCGWWFDFCLRRRKICMISVTCIFYCRVIHKYIFRRRTYYFDVETSAGTPFNKRLALYRYSVIYRYLLLRHLQRLFTDTQSFTGTQPFSVTKPTTTGTLPFLFYF